MSLFYDLILFLDLFLVFCFHFFLIWIYMDYKSRFFDICGLMLMDLFLKESYLYVFERENGCIDESIPQIKNLSLNLFASRKKLLYNAARGCAAIYSALGISLTTVFFLSEQELDSLIRHFHPAWTDLLFWSFSLLPQ